MAYLAQDEVTLKHIKKDFEGYSFNSLRLDFLAGISIALLTVPQALAYAFLAGLPVSCGLFAGIYSAFIAAFFGSSKHLIVGPSNAIAILIQAGIADIMFTHYPNVSPDNMQQVTLYVLSQLMLLIGLIQVAAAFFKLGRLTQFVSHTVIVGYMVGVAIALVVNQLFPLFGIPSPTHLNSLFARLIYIFTNFSETHILTLIIGTASFITLILIRRFDKRIPAGALMLSIVAGIAFIFTSSFNFFLNSGLTFIDWQWVGSLFQNVVVVGHTGSENLIPSIALPYFDPAILNQLLPVAFAISLLSVMESTSAAKSTAACSGQRLSMNQEIFGVGLANLSAAFFGAMPISGSPSRTTMSFEMGAKTRLAAIFNSIFALFFLFVFGFLIQHIPIAAFAALLIASAVNIVQPKQLLICLKATRADTFVLVLTILGCIFLSLDVAFYMGVILSITLYLKKSAVPQIVEYTVDKNGALVQMQKSEPRKIRFIKVEGELFFGAADIFHSMLKNIAEDDTTTQVIILQMRNARDIDATACLALKQLFEFMRSLGKHLIVCGLTHQVWETLCDSDILDTIGKENLFIYNEKEPSQSSKKALLRAYKIVGDSFETGHKDVERLKLTLQGAEVKVKHQIT